MCVTLWLARVLQDPTAERDLGLSFVCATKITVRQYVWKGWSVTTVNVQLWSFVYLRLVSFAATIFILFVTGVTDLWPSSLIPHTNYSLKPTPIISLL